jgi:DNA-binding response OmpR family regulator
MAPVEWILLVEDEADQRLLVREALGRVSAQVQVHEAVDAESGMAWLRRNVGDAFFLKGGMVVLDLGLPRASGFRVLEWMREVPAFEKLPVVVLTASENPMDADHAFNLGARGYFQKPADPRRYVEIFQRALRVVEGPSRSAERP